jgi:hypothetical protein
MPHLLQISSRLSRIIDFVLVVIEVIVTVDVFHDVVASATVFFFLQFGSLNKNIQKQRTQLQATMLTPGQ